MNSVPQQISLGDVDDFEPQARERAFTWPLPRPERFIAGTATPGVSVQEESVENVVDVTGNNEQGKVKQGLPPVKKVSSRRNPWGNQSYADLIAEAISNAPNERLTLSEIYEWMIRNFSFFREKGEINSGAGWKNSIRHNLSLHNRFMRVQNKDVGKSSWWMINHDAKSGKSSRRRANTMDTSNFTRKRTRISKKIESLKNYENQQADILPTPSNSVTVNETLGVFAASPLQSGRELQLSPNFRPRASSIASSCGSPSPIPAASGDADWTVTYTSYSPEQLAGNLAKGMKLEPYQMHDVLPTDNQQQAGQPLSYYETQCQEGNSLSIDSFCLTLQSNTQSANQQGYMIHDLQSCAWETNPSPAAGVSLLYQQTEPNLTTLEDHQRQTIQYAVQAQQQSLQQQLNAQQQTDPEDSSFPHTQARPDPVTSMRMGHLMSILNNSVIPDDLNINIESLYDFNCNVEEVIEHDLCMDESLDFDFQQTATCTATIQVTGGSIGHNITSQNDGCVT